MIAVAAAVLLSVIVLFNPGLGPATHQRAGPAESSHSQPTKRLTEARLTRTSGAAGIEVSVVFMNPLLLPTETKGMLVFKVALNAHFGDHLSHDFTKLATLRTDDGTSLREGFAWEPIMESSHHRQGRLKVANEIDGQTLFDESTQYIELELADIGVPSRLFKWTQEQLSAKPLSEAKIIRVN